MSTWPDVMPSVNSSFEHPGALENKSREESADLPRFATPSSVLVLGMPIDNVRHSASPSSQNNSQSPVVAPFSGRESNSPSRSSSRDRSPAAAPARNHNMKSSLVRRVFPLSANARGDAQQRTCETRGSGSDVSDARSRSNQSEFVREMPSRVTDASPIQSSLGSQHTPGDSNILCCSDAYDFSDFRRSLDGSADKENTNNAQPAIAVANQRNDDVPEFPPLLSQEHNIEARNGASYDGCFARNAKESLEPIPSHLVRNARECSDVIEPHKAKKKDALARTQREGQLDQAWAQTQSEESFYREIYFSPHRKAEVENVLRSLPRDNTRTLLSYHLIGTVVEKNSLSVLAKLVSHSFLTRWLEKCFCSMCCLIV